MKRYIKANKSKYINVDLWESKPKYVVWFGHLNDGAVVDKIALANFYSLDNANDYVKYLESQSGEIEVGVDIL